MTSGPCRRGAQGRANRAQVARGEAAERVHRRRGARSCCGLRWEHVFELSARCGFPKPCTCFMRLTQVAAAAVMGNRPTQGVGLADRPARELLERTSDASLDPARSRRRDRRQVNTPPRYCSTHILGPRPTVKLRSELTKSWNAAATAMDATLKIGYKPSARCEESRRVHHVLCSRPSQGERHASLRRSDGRQLSHSHERLHRAGDEAAIPPRDGG